MIRVIKAFDLKLGDVFEIATNLVEVVDILKDENEGDKSVSIKLKFIISDAKRPSDIILILHERTTLAILGNVKDAYESIFEEEFVTDLDTWRRFWCGVYRIPGF